MRMKCLTASDAVEGIVGEHPVALLSNSGRCSTPWPWQCGSARGVVFILRRSRGRGPIATSAQTGRIGQTHISEEISGVATGAAYSP